MIKRSIVKNILTNLRQSIVNRRAAQVDQQTTFDRGFTLIELLITITILPLVIGAISVGLVSIFSLQTNTNNRLLNSGDAQLVSATFIKDVQSAEQITTESTSTPQCGTGSQLLGLQWNSGQNIVSYVTTTAQVGSSTRYSLVRQSCTLGNTTTPSSSATVSNNLQATQSPPTIQCSATASSCSAPAQWISTAGVLNVTWAITEPLSNFSYSLTATPRAWTSQSGGAPPGGLPYAPLTLLDPSSCNALNVGQGTISINVAGGTGNGSLDVASNCPNTVSISNGGTLSASSVITSDQTLNSIAPNSKATYPSQEYYSNQFKDPFSSLSTPSQPSGSGTSCTSQQTTSGGVTQTTYSCPPGVYTTPPSFSTTSTTTINFTEGGTYSFEQGLNLPNNATVNLAGGTYIFNGSAPLTTGNNVAISGNDVLLYIGSGNVSLGNNSNITLSSMSGYDGIVIWDSVNQGTITIGNNTNLSYNLNLNGGIYIPQGSISTNSNVSLSTTFLLAGTANFGNNLSMTISSP